MELMNFIYSIVIKCLYCAFKSTIIMLLLNYSSINKTLNYNLIFYIIFFVYIFIFAMVYFFKNKALEIKTKNRIIILSIFIYSFLAAIIIYWKISIASIIFNALIFLIISIDAYRKTYININKILELIVIFILVIITFSFIDVYIDLNRNISYIVEYGIAVNNNIIMFFIIGVIYFIDSNFTKAYKKGNSNSNTTRVFIIKLIFSSIIGAIVLFKNQFISFFKIQFEKLNIIFIWIYNICNNIFSFLMNSFFGYIKKILNSKKVEFNYSFDEKQIDNIENEKEIAYEKIKEITDSVNITQIIVYVLSILLLIGVIIVLLHYIKKEKNKTIGEFNKEFIKADKINIKAKIKKKIYNIKINDIRKKYIKKVNSFIKEGYKYNEDYTPNDFLNILPLTHKNYDSFSKLTDEYNEIRYGTNS